MAYLDLAIILVMLQPDFFQFLQAASEASIDWRREADFLRRVDLDQGPSGPQIRRE